jgi:positive phototaxis protein PixI
MQALETVPVDQETLKELGNLGDFSSLGALFSEPAPAEIGERFLRLQLCPETSSLLEVKDIAAVISVLVTDILPVPHMPSCVLGLYNWRGEMLWLIDLGQQVGFPGLLSDSSSLSQCMAVIVEINGQALGFCVSQVHDIESHDLQSLHMASSEMFSEKFLFFIKGYLTGDRTTVLNLSTLLQDSALNIHPH